MTRPRDSADVLERRRREAIELVRAGLSLNEVGRRMRCAASSVMRWYHSWQRRGPDGLKVGRPPGRPSKLDPAKRLRLIALLSQGPAAHGYQTERWTTVEIAEILQRRCGLHYHRSHITRLLHRMGWTYQDALHGWAPRHGTSGNE